MAELVECPVAARIESRYANVTLAPGLDGAVFRLGKGPYTPVGAPIPEFTVGEPCRSATDRQACLATVAATRAKSGWSFWSPSLSGRNDSGDYGVVTRGDEVRALSSFEELREAIAPIDSAREAVQLVFLSGRSVDCQLKNVTATAEGWLVRTTEGGCAAPVTEVIYLVDRKGGISISQEQRLEDPMPGCISGRRPMDFVSSAASATSWLESLPAHLAEIAHMEEAAVLAFDELARWFAHHGAPGELLLRLSVSRADEVEHASLMTSLAHDAGAPVRPVPPPQASRLPTLFELAMANATEGCVREAYGALVATHQAVHASDPKLRSAFARIAEDEARHAELSFDLADWLAPRLTEAERAAVACARAEALTELARTVAVEPVTEVRARAGMPSAKAASALLEAFARTCLATELAA